MNTEIEHLRRFDDRQLYDLAKSHRISAQQYRLEMATRKAMRVNDELHASALLEKQAAVVGLEAAGEFKTAALQKQIAQSKAQAAKIIVDQIAEGVEDETLFPELVRILGSEEAATRAVAEAGGGDYTPQSIVKSASEKWAPNRAVGRVGGSF